MRGAELAKGADRDGLYKSDKEIARLIGLSYATWRKSVAGLERAGLPRRDPAFLRRRYWPAVQAWLDRRNGMDARSALPKRVVEENFS